MGLRAPAEILPRQSFMYLVDDGGWSWFAKFSLVTKSLLQTEPSDMLFEFLWYNQDITVLKYSKDISWTYVDLPCFSPFLLTFPVDPPSLPIFFEHMFQSHQKVSSSIPEIPWFDSYLWPMSQVIPLCSGSFQTRAAPGLETFQCDVDKAVGPSLREEKNGPKKMIHAFSLLDFV